MKALIILRGIPGSGKTTVASVLQDELSTVYSADDYFMHDGVYKWDASKIGNAHAECQSNVAHAMKNGQPKIFVANTNTTKKELEPYYRMAEEHGYKVYSLIVENRHNGQNVHNVPKDTLEKMSNRFDIML
jgi:predicted kinase